MQSDRTRSFQPMSPSMDIFKEIKIWWKPLKKKQDLKIEAKILKFVVIRWNIRWKIKCVKTENICHLFSSTSCWEKPLEIITLKGRKLQKYSWCNKSKQYLICHVILIKQSFILLFTNLYSFLWGEVIFQLCITLTTLSGNDFKPYYRDLLNRLKIWKNKWEKNEV